MPDRVCQLGPPDRFEERQQVEIAAVVRPMAITIERDDAQGVTAPAKRAGNQVRRVDPFVAPAHDAWSAGNRGTLRVGGGH